LSCTLAALLSRNLDFIGKPPVESPFTALEVMEYEELWSSSSGASYDTALTNT